MVEEMIGNLSMIFPDTVINNINILIRIIQALGGIIILYLIFQIIHVIFKRRDRKVLEKINKNLENIKEILSKNNSKSNIKISKKIKNKK